MSVPFRYRKLGYVALNVCRRGTNDSFALNIGGLDAAEKGRKGAAVLLAAPITEKRCFVPRRASQASSARLGARKRRDVRRAYATTTSQSFGSRNG